MPRKKTPRRSLGVFADLVRAIDWYDVSLQTIIASKNMQTVNRTQSVMLIHVAEGITRPSDIAHEMGTTRQNIHAMAKPMIDSGLLKVVPDPEDGRSKQYAFGEDSQELRDTVIQVLKFLDRKLGERIGKTELNALKRALSSDWGDIVTEYKGKR